MLAGHQATSGQTIQMADVPFRLLRDPDPILFWVDEHSDYASLSSRRHFLRYYTQTFHILLTSNMENNCFLSGEAWTLLSYFSTRIILTST